MNAHHGQRVEGGGCICSPDTAFVQRVLDRGFYRGGDVVAGRVGHAEVEYGSSGRDDACQGQSQQMRRGGEV